ncbi:hypothetical protein [Pseudomonas sp. BF-R-21]|uniref:hypothetical protein n=1 Tax=Pseudomonas sp. BF-R-21 TaxID=2832387 RepID=UPI001CBCF007|nr:hypothetical protein [Pseudomonas sp. BF-R-21]
MALSFDDLPDEVAAPKGGLSFDDLPNEATGPRDFTNRYNTPLAPAEEQKFNQWAQANNRVKDSYDYDMRGAFQELMSGQTQQADNGHFTDKFKKPNHPTFSDESQYNGTDGLSGGQWVETPKGTYFAPGQSQSKLWPEPELNQYFQQQEPDITLLAPDLRDRIANGTVAPPQPPSTSGQVVMDDGQPRAQMSPLVAQYAGNPRIQAAQQIKRGTLAGEAAAFGPMMNQAFHQTLIPSMIDYQQSGAADRSAASDANWRAGMLDGGLDQLDPRQRQMAMLDPVLAAQGMGLDNVPERSTTPDDQRQLAQILTAAAIPKEASFGQRQRLDRAESEAIPSYDIAQGALGKLFAGAGSLTANLAGSVPAIENLVPAERGLTLLQTAKNAFLPNAAAGVITDPLVQANQIGAGLQDKYSGEQTAAAGVVGGVAGSALAAGFQVPSAIRGWIEARVGKRLEDLAPDEAAYWKGEYDRIKAVSEAGQRTAEDPAFQAGMVQQNTGLNAARPTDPASVAAQRAANKVRGSELAETFNDINVWPRDQVQVGPESVEIPDGTLPVRDAAGEQARVDTLAPRGQAADMARQMGIENPSARDLDIIVRYMENGLSPRGAVNAFRRAATAADREGMTPDLARTEGEQANSRQFAKDAFDIADIRRQRRERELDRWEPELEPDYSAGAGRADELTPRMQQDLAARSEAPYAGPEGHVGTTQPAPRRSVDVIGSKSVGGLRGEHLPGQRSPAPEVPPVGRTADMFEAERTEPRLEGPAEVPRQEPATEVATRETPVEAPPVEPVAAAPKAEPTATRENLSPEQKERLAVAERGNEAAKRILEEERAKPDNAHNTQHWEREVAESDRRLKGMREATDRGAKNAPTPDQKTWYDYQSVVRDAEQKAFRAENGTAEQKREAAVAQRDLENYEKRHAEEIKRGRQWRDDYMNRDPEDIRKANLAERERIAEMGKFTGDDQLNLDAIRKTLAEDSSLSEREKEGLRTVEKRLVDRQGREAPVTPTPETKAPPKTDEAGNAEKLRQLEHELSLSRYFEDDAGTVADLESQIADLKGGEPAPKAAPKAESPAALDKATADALKERLDRFDWEERGGKLLRDTEGKVTGRTKWLSNDPQVHQLIRDAGYSIAQARNLLNRAMTGKGKPLSEGQQALVDDLLAAHKGPQEAAGDDFALDQHTDSDLQARERETQQAQDKQASERKAAENKAQADKERDDFTLSGSDRPADVAASRGQNTLFDVTGAAIHSGKTAINAVGKGIKALAKAIWQGDDNRNASEHARDLADPLAQLIERKGPAVEGRVRAGIRKFFDSAEASLKELSNKTESPTLKQLGDVFHATAGKGDGTKPTLDERSQRALFGGKKGYMNRAEGIHNFLHDNKLTDPKAVDQIIKLVENPGTPRTGKIGEAANLISDFFKDAHAYLKAAGIDMGEVKGYFPREHDVSLVESKRTQFVDAAAKAYKQDNPALSPTDARAKAEDYWSAVVHGRDIPPGGGGQSSVNPRPDFMKGRIFSKAAAKHLEPFYTRNVGGMLSNYALRAVRRAEVAKSGVDINGKFQPFGDNFANWKTITDAALKEDPRAREVLDQINQLVSVNAGIPTSNYGRTAENAMSWVRTAGTLGMLEKSALASVGELATSPLRGAMGNAGDIANIAQNLGSHAINTLRAVVGKKGRSQSVKEAFAFADEIGATTESQQGSTAAARFEGNEPGSKIQNQLLTSFFKRNMLTPLTEYTRAMSAQQARIFMQRLAKDGSGAKRDLFLRELGVPKGKEQAFADYVATFGKKLPTADDLKGEFGELYKNMALRFVDQSVQRPNAATKPAWASHPLGKMVFQFQSFNYAFQKNVLNRMVRLAVLNKELSASQKAALATSFGVSVSAMTGIQAMITELRERLYSRPDQKKLTPGAKMEGTVSRTGLLGVADPWIQMVNGGLRYGRDPSQSLLGPTLGQASGTLGAFLARDSKKTNTAERKEARMAYQTFGEPLAQAALSALPAGPLVKAATVYGVPKLGEVLTDKFLPDNHKHTKADDKPIKGMVESVANLFSGEDDEPAEPTKPQRAGRPPRPQRPVKP